MFMIYPNVPLYHENWILYVIMNRLCHCKLNSTPKFGVNRAWISCAESSSPCGAHIPACRTYIIMFMYLLPESSEPLMIDLSSEGRPANDFHFTLTSETSAPYFIWAPNQPSRASENCVTLRSDGYHDVGCGTTSGRVCEFEST